MDDVENTPNTEANGEGATTASSTKTPLEHGRDAGLVRNTNAASFDGKVSVVRSAEYRVAEYLHGWNRHDRYSKDSLQISRADFDAAIEAAAKPNDSGKHIPHASALAPHLKGNS